MISKYECIFLDRDGTINFDPGYISKVKDFKFYNYTFKALRLLKPLTKSFIIITNQSGVTVIFPCLGVSSLNLSVRSYSGVFLAPSFSVL